jgi:hypothetical protein
MSKIVAQYKTQSGEELIVTKQDDGKYEIKIHGGVGPITHSPGPIASLVIADSDFALFVTSLVEEVPA